MRDEPTERDVVVTRVEDPSGSHIEPPLNQRADDLTKLRWHLAVLFEDEGVRLHVRQTSRRTYALSGTGFGLSPMDFHQCWTYINGVGRGVREAAALRGDEETEA